ncbi:MAG: hypothetical protein ACYCOR_10830 [Acidobacteriaceae bacterium]
MPNSEDTTTRIDLSEYQEGAYVVLSTVVPWGLAKRIISRLQSGDGSLEVVDIVVDGLAKEWNVRGIDGEPVTLPLAKDALDGVDSRLVVALTEQTNKILEGLRGKVPGVAATEDSSSES